MFTLRFAFDSARIGFESKRKERKKGRKKEGNVDIWGENTIFIRVDGFTTRLTDAASFSSGAGEKRKREREREINCEAVKATRRALGNVKSFERSPSEDQFVRRGNLADTVARTSSLSPLETQRRKKGRKELAEEKRGKREPVEEALRKQWKATCTHSRTHAGRKASRLAGWLVGRHARSQPPHGKGDSTTIRGGQAGGTGSKRERVRAGKRGGSTS